MSPSLEQNNMSVITPPNIVRTAYAELIVTDLERSRWFWVEMLGFVITAEDADALYLRGYEELSHHSLVLRKGKTAANACIAFRVWADNDIDIAAAWYSEKGCRVEHRGAGSTRGIGRCVRVEDPFGFTVEFFNQSDKAERLLQRFDLYRGAAIARIDHFNICVNNLHWDLDALKQSKMTNVSMHLGCTENQASMTLQPLAGQVQDCITLVFLLLNRKIFYESAMHLGP
jgi:catechol 2,3-dioxygenase-like lactoylglutathione lyase family enzyme